MKNLFKHMSAQERRWFDQEEHALLQMGLVIGMIGAILLLLTVRVLFDTWIENVTISAICLLSIQLAALTVVIPLGRDGRAFALPVSLAWHLFFFFILKYDTGIDVITSAAGLSCINILLLLVYPSFGRGQIAIFTYLVLVSPFALSHSEAAFRWATINTITLTVVLGFRVLYRMWSLNRYNHLVRAASHSDHSSEKLAS
jgi:hypothetical protein